MSDYYYTVINNRNVRQYNSSVVVVGIDGCSREEIADVIEQIEFCQPRVIGLDVIFPYVSSEYPRLIEAVKGCENIVLPLNMDYDDTNDVFKTSSVNTLFYDHIPQGSYGVVNLVASNAMSVVREFRPLFRTESDVKENFALKIVSAADPEAADMARRRGNELETISYSAVDFEIIRAAEVMSHMDILYDKIVLVGTLDDYSDMHITPIDSRMPGVMIHAYVVAMVLNGNFIREVAPWVNWLIAMVLCYCVVLLDLLLDKCKVKKMLMRLAQAFMMYVIVLIGCQMFIKYDIYLNLAFPVMMVGLGLAAEDMCSGLYKLWNMIIEKFT